MYDKIVDPVTDNLELGDGEEEGSFEDLKTQREVEDVKADNDELESSLGGEETSPNIPDKFKGKSVEDIVNSYQELEKRFSQQGQDLGEQRKLIDQLLDLNKQNTSQTQERDESNNEVTYDDFVDDPASAVNKAVKGPLSELEEKINQLTLEKKEMEFAQKRPDFKETVKSQDFLNWVSASPYRANLFRQADQYDFNAADELFGLWDEYSTINNSKHKQQEEEIDASKKEQLEKLSLESGGSKGNTSKKIFKRSEIVRLKIEDPQRYSEYEPEIRQAYAEGRVR